MLCFIFGVKSIVYVKKLDIYNDFGGCFGVCLSLRIIYYNNIYKIILRERQS